MIMHLSLKKPFLSQMMSLICMVLYHLWSIEKANVLNVLGKVCICINVCRMFLKFIEDHDVIYCGLGKYKY